MEIQYVTDVGRRRQTNQDKAGVFLDTLKQPLMIVADGMGGHQAGDVASKMLVDLLGAEWTQSGFESLPELTAWLQLNLQKINDQIYQVGQADASKSGMGTTAVIAAVIGNQLFCANVGDSRLYLIRNKTIKQLSEDHSLVHELVKTGEITEEMAANHPRKNVLTRSIGMPTELVVDQFTIELEQGDWVLLCSDGLTNMVSDETILAVCSDYSSIDEALNELVNRANDAGGADNITALLLATSEENEVLQND